jgi:hypothetical protein
VQGRPAVSRRRLVRAGSFEIPAPHGPVDDGPIYPIFYPISFLSCPFLFRRRVQYGQHHDISRPLETGFEQGRGAFSQLASLRDPSLTTQGHWFDPSARPQEELGIRIRPRSVASSGARPDCASCEGRLRSGSRGAQGGRADSMAFGHRRPSRLSPAMRRVMTNDATMTPDGSAGRRCNADGRGDMCPNGSWFSL